MAKKQPKKKKAAKTNKPKKAPNTPSEVITPKKASIKNRRNQFRIFLDEFTKIKREKDSLGINPNKCANFVSKYILEEVKKSELENSYNIVFLMQGYDYSITPGTSDGIYSTATARETNKKILLILNSSGGSIEPAYFISKACKEYSKKFVVAVPRMAKSAATLISLGADEIHMGSISELGPIDPQIRRLPALALGEAVEYIASISEKYPKSSDMFAKFMSNELDLQTLGHTRRIADSAVDYAERLLLSKKSILPKPPSEIGKRLVRGYKDHGFVIDKDEATEILSDKVIKINTPEYQLSNKIYKIIDSARLALWAATRDDYDFNLVGTANDLWFSKNEN